MPATISTAALAAAPMRMRMMVSTWITIGDLEGLIVRDQISDGVIVPSTAIRPIRSNARGWAGLARDHKGARRVASNFAGAKRERLIKRLPSKNRDSEERLLH
jgi:hypothetical protein